MHISAPKNQKKFIHESVVKYKIFDRMLPIFNGSPSISKYVGINKNAHTKTNNIIRIILNMCFRKLKVLLNNKYPLVKKNNGTQVDNIVLPKYNK